MKKSKNRTPPRGWKKIIKSQKLKKFVQKKQDGKKIKGPTVEVESHELPMAIFRSVKMQMKHNLLKGVLK